MLQALSKPDIKKKLRSNVVNLIENLDVLEQVDSTNLQLSKNKISDKFSVCIANAQTAGKGRRGNQWVSPGASNVYLSISHQFSEPPSALSGLGLVVGIICAKALKQLTGYDKIKLKWPNDLMINDKKLGGILIENQSTTDNKSMAIIGIGINVAMDSTTQLDIPWINLKDIDNTTSRNQIISTLLNHLIPALNNFNSKTLTNMLSDWHQLDWTKNQLVKLSNKTTTIYGTAIGINQQGALLLETDGKIQEIHSGDLSLRKTNVTA